MIPRSPSLWDRIRAFVAWYVVAKIALLAFWLWFVYGCGDANAPPPCSWRYTKYLAIADTSGTYTLIPIDSVYDCQHAPGAY